MQNSLMRMWALLGVVAAIAAIAASSAGASHKAVQIVIWTDSDRAAAVTKVANRTIDLVRRASPSRALRRDSPQGERGASIG